MKIIALLLLFFGASAGAADRELVYHLLADRRDADLDYPLLERLQQRERRAGDELAAETPPHDGHTMFVSANELEPLFRTPVPGRFRVLTFCALEVGRYPEPVKGRSDFIAHHLLVLKTDSDDRILDGFYFIREFSEGPVLPMLLRFQSTDRLLVKGLQLTSGDFRRLNGGKPEHWNPAGRLDNLLNFVEAF